MIFILSKIWLSTVPEKVPTLKKIGNTTRSFRYDYVKSLTIIQWKWKLNSRDQIWYTECLKNYWWRFVTLSRTWWPKQSPRKRNATRQNGCLRRLLQIAEKRSERKRRKEKIYLYEWRLQRIARRDKKPFLSKECKEKRKTVEWKRLEIFSRKLEISREHFRQRWVW